MRSYEKLMATDKVDIILPPWGTGANFAVAPVANKLRLPDGGADRAVAEAGGHEAALLLRDAAAAQADDERAGRHARRQRRQDRRRDLHGRPLRPRELRRAGAALQGTGIKMVDKKSYPLGVKDLSTMLKGMKAANPDAFIGITYPPDNFLITGQSKEIGFAPKFFYTAVGTAFPIYRERMGRLPKA